MVLAVAGLMFSHSGVVLSGDVYIAGAGQRDHHVDWHLLITQLYEGVARFPRLYCLPTPSSAWRG